MRRRVREGEGAKQGHRAPLYHSESCLEDGAMTKDRFSQPAAVPEKLVLRHFGARWLCQAQDDPQGRMPQ